VQEDGAFFGALLRETFADHPHVGDVRGRGFFWGIELVADKAEKRPFNPALKVHANLKKDAMARGLLCYPFGGTVDGVNGDHVLLAPPYIASRDELKTIASLLAESVDAITRHAAIAA
jgi:adenosylmethionine-8-amino-7-oxononanoate aminotransferase